MNDLFCFKRNIYKYREVSINHSRAYLIFHILGRTVVIFSHMTFKIILNNFYRAVNGVGCESGGGGGPIRGGRLFTFFLPDWMVTQG